MNKLMDSIHYNDVSIIDTCTKWETSHLKCSIEQMFLDFKIHFLENSESFGQDLKNDDSIIK